MKLKIILAGLFFATLFNLGCQKELSLEDGGDNPGGGGGTNPPIGSNCRVSKIIAADSATGIGLYSLATTFNSNDQGTRVEGYDSIAHASDFVVNISYSGDTIRVSPNEYFLTDGSGRLMNFYTYEDPSDTTTEQIIYTYYYNSNGYLVSKDISAASVPFPLVQFIYTWSSGNLVNIVGSIPGLGQKVMTADLDYDGSRSAKNFISIFPDAFETAPYIMFLNLGQKSNNLVKKITLTIYNDTGGVDQTLVTSFRDYVFSSDGYLIQWYADGDQQLGSALFNGLTKFDYHCK